MAAKPGLRCSFEFVQAKEFPQFPADCVFIRDRSIDHGGMTITNDAETVVEYLFGTGHLVKGTRLFYLDSEGEIAEILIRDGKFNGFGFIAETMLGLTRVEQIIPGRRVECDLCSADWTERKESGGVYGWMTKAICPDCAPRFLVQAEADGELQYLKASCPAGKSFADWVREDLR